MKLNELMLGDWVYINGKMTKMVVILCESFASDIILENPLLTEVIPIKVKVKPIKITPDVMKMFGFKLKPVNTSIYIHKSYGKKRLMIEFYDGKVIVFVFTDGFDELRVKVRYIHELQHAMRLMGIKKELELKEVY